MGGDDPVQQGSEGTVRGVLRTPGHLAGIAGLWVAHGEGCCFWPDDAVKEEAMRQNCVALKYVDDDGNVTMEFPMDLNRLVGLTSSDGLYV